jgi:hypothetical protein
MSNEFILRERHEEKQKSEYYLKFLIFAVDTIPNFFIIEDEHLGSGYQWLPDLSRASTIGALFPQVMETDEVLKKYAKDFSLVTVQQWYKNLPKGKSVQL